MPSFNDLEEAPRRELTIFYVLDTSGSMAGEPIAQLNRAMEETVDILKNQARSNADAKLKIAVLEFSSECSWLNNQGPEDMEDFMWTDLRAGGLTQVGDVLTELDSKLSRSAFLQSMTGAYLPVIIFMTDGYATDEYDKALAKIRQNKWFARATKIGFALGDDADLKMISEVVGNCEAVVRTSDLEVFKKLIRFVSVTSSMMASTSRTSTDPLSGATILEQIAQSDPDAGAALVGSADVQGYDAEPEPVADDDLDDEWA